MNRGDFRKRYQGFVTFGVCDLDLGLRLARLHIVRVLGKANLDHRYALIQVDLSLRLSVGGKPPTETSLCADGQPPSQVQIACLTINLHPHDS